MLFKILSHKVGTGTDQSEHMLAIDSTGGWQGSGDSICTTGMAVLVKMPEQ